jgi:hypothetical protein
VDGHSRIKEVNMSSMLRVLPVQPYDTMGSVLIEYDVRVQPRVLTVGGMRNGQASLVEYFF